MCSVVGVKAGKEKGGSHCYEKEGDKYFFT